MGVLQTGNFLMGHLGLRPRTFVTLPYFYSHQWGNIKRKNGASRGSNVSFMTDWMALLLHFLSRGVK